MGRIRVLIGGFGIAWALGLCAGMAAPVQLMTSSVDASTVRATDQAQGRRHAGCGHGSVYLGHRERFIGFRVRCAASNAKVAAYFSLQRYSLSGPHHQLHLGAFSHALQVSIKNSGSGHGSCSLQARRVLLACHAGGGKAFVARGWIKAPPGRRCAFGYTITSVTRKSCGPVSCGGPLPISGLFEGRPRGC